MRRLNLDQLEAFVEVVRVGSFSAAAARLNLTQPAVSQQVAQLERRVGTRLIERVGRRAQPTPAGEELLEHAARIDGAVSAAFDAMGRFASGDSGRVRLGTGATAAIYLLPPVLRGLRRRLPGLEITVATGNSADIVKAVQDNALDVGLVTLPVSGRSLDVTPLLDDEFVAVTARDSPPLPSRVTAAALAGRPILLFEPGGQTRQVADRWFARSGVEVRPAMALGSVEAIKRLVAAGLGCAVLPAVATGDPGDAAQLVVRRLSPRLHRKLALVVRRDKVLQRGLRETIAALKGLRTRAS